MSACVRNTWVAPHGGSWLHVVATVAPRVQCSTWDAPIPIYRHNAVHTLYSSSSELNWGTEDLCAVVRALLQTAAAGSSAGACCTAVTRDFPISEVFQLNFAS